MGNHIIKEDNLEVYTPEIGESQEIGIDQTTTSYSPRLNKLKEGETIQVKLNEKAIKWRISHDLYKDFKSGVRELFQNEARACRQARDKYNAKPKIVVKINSDTKSLSIKG
jgi:TusA-related sulfurtransferase